MARRLWLATSTNVTPISVNNVNKLNTTSSSTPRREAANAARRLGIGGWGLGAGEEEDAKAACAVLTPDP